MKVLNRDLLEIEEGVICQQVNARGVMNAGIALAIRRKWPQVYEEYRRVHESHPGLRLGNVVSVPVSSRLMVCNVIGQDDYRPRGVCHTDYAAVKRAFHKINLWKRGRRVYIPYGMGCGLAGGDWGVYAAIVEEACPGVVSVRKQR